MVSKTQVIINFMLKNSEEKDHKMYSERLSYYYFLNKEKRFIIREGEITNTRASYFEINQLYAEFIEATVNKKKKKTIANKEKKKEYRKQYYKNNKKKENEYSKQYYQANKEKIKECSKQYYQANKEKIKMGVEN